MFKNLSPDRRARILRTFIQAVTALLITFVLAVIAVVSDIARAEFSDQAWLPILMVVLTTLTSWIQNARDAKKE